MKQDDQDIDKPDIHSSSIEYTSRFSGGVGEWFLNVQNGKTEKLLKSVPNRNRALDVGGGHAQNVEVTEKLGMKLDVLGSDDACFDYLRSKYPNFNGALIVGNLVQSELKDSSYPIVMSYRILAHINDWKAHISELCRISSQTVILEFPNVNSVNRIADALFGLKKKIEGNTRTYQLFSRNQIVEEFKENGFSLVGDEGQYIAPMVVHRALKSAAISKVLERLLSLILPQKYLGSPLILKFENLGN